MHLTQLVRSSALVAAVLFMVADAHAVPCDGGVIGLGSGATVDLGWTGLARDEALPGGASLGFEVLRRCSDDSSPCTQDADCTNNDCQATCDCEGDSSCEIAGPAGPRKCLSTLADCVSDADCPMGIPCVTVLGPPMPISAGGAPACIVGVVDTAWTGELDATNGDLSTDAVAMRWRVFLGISLEQPCPSCGGPGDNPEIGDAFLCSGGPADGDPCVVEGVTPDFGGTSSDCPPELSANVTGSGLAIRLPELTTGSASRTAALACSGLGFTGNPLVPGSNPKCTDTTGPADPVCASNADCTRCTGDPSIACATNGDCLGNGTCAESPDQPITCGFWCHCGFCDNNPALPCFESGDCPTGTCVVGGGAGSVSNAPQSRPNNCSSDGFVCGGTAGERCDTDTTSSCSDQPFRNCSENADCAAFSAGTCDEAPRACFEPEISRSGQASAVGGHCRDDRATCMNNADCVSPGDECVADSSATDAVALFCSGASSSGTVNTTLGITGPGTIGSNGLLQLCRCDAVEPGCADFCASIEPYCGDGTIDPGEQCDGGPCCGDDCFYAIAGSTCRAAVGGCDVEEVCNGVSTSCPPDELAADGTPCDDGQFCTEDDACDAGACEGTARDCSDGNACTTDSCDDNADACVAVEEPVDVGSCLIAPKSSLQLVDSSTAGKDKVAWKWTAGEEFAHPYLGTPRVDTTYALCVYDYTAGSPSLAASFEIAPSDTRWLDKDPNGFQYKDREGVSDGITKVQLKPGAAGKSKVKVSGGGASLLLPGPAGASYLNQNTLVVAQLVSSAGACWSSSFEIEDARINDADSFKAVVK